MTAVLPERTAPAPVAHTAPHRAGALSLSAMTPADAWRFCEALANTPLLPDQYRKQPASVLWAMEYGRALGLDVVTTITTIHVIKGKPSQSADLMLSRTRAAGHRVRIQQEPGQCTVSVWRADDPEFENRVTWTYDDAVTAGLCELRNNRPYSRSQKNEPQAWEKYPRAMLRARAISECVRMACPEVLHGAIYTPEELGAVIDQEGNPLPDVAPSFERQAPRQADQWQQPAPAVATQQTPPEAPPESQVEQRPDDELSPQARALIAAAQAARTPDEARQVRADAEKAGAPAVFLTRLNGIMADLFAPAPHSMSDAVGASGAFLDEPLPGAPDDRKALGLALADMLAAGATVGVSGLEVRQMFVARFGHGAQDGTVAELRAIEAELREVAEGQS